MLTIDVLRQIDDSSLPGDEEIMHWATVAYQQKHDSEVAITLCDAAQSQQLNYEYRNKNKPTNVLSFSGGAPLLENISHLGDIVICAPIVQSEAKQQAKNVQAHWAHMVIHGMLHLQGYDHLNDTDANKMEALETKIMYQLDFDNPYQIIDTAT